MSQWIGCLLDVFFSCLLKRKSFQQPLAKSAPQVAAAAASLPLRTCKVDGHRSSSALMKGLQHRSGGWGDAAAPGCRLRVPPAPAAGGTAQPPPPAGVPAPACARCAPTCPDPLRKSGGKGEGGGERGDSCSPFPKAARASRDAGVGKGGRSPRGGSEGTGPGVRWVWRASAGGEEVYSGKAIVCP